MVKRLIVLLLLFSSFSYAETIKTDVLVIGGSTSAATAAIQCARSKLKTILIAPGDWLATGMPAGLDYNIMSNQHIPTGIWAEFNDKLVSYYKSTTGYDAPGNVTLKFDSSTGANILRRIADSVKNLTIKLNSPLSSIKKDGTGWDVTITENGATYIINAKVVIDATGKAEAVTKAGATMPAIDNSTKPNDVNLYRTSIATSDVLPTGFIAMRDVLVKDADNLLVTEKILPINGDMNYLPLQMALGQGVGTIAAYCAFFKTSTKNIRVRIVQQELLDYKAYLLPIADVKRNDRYIRAVQQIAATGMLKCMPKNGCLFFNPDGEVATEEIKPVLTEIYTRAFIWFNKEKLVQEFTVGNLLSLISEMTLSDPQILQNTMRNDWNSKFHFTSNFDVNRPVTRIEFAALVNQFLNPFARTIDLAGNIVN